MQTNDEIYDHSKICRKFSEIFLKVLMIET